MRYDVQKLRDATEQAIAENAYRRADDYDRKLKQWYADRDQHVAHTAESWRQFALLIGRRNRAKKPITMEDLPYSNRYGRIAVFDKREPVNPGAEVPASLATVRAALAVVTDDTVSANDLGRLGVQASALRTVFEIAGSTARA